LLIIAIDPGREKFGYALFRDGKVEERGILPLSNLRDLREKYREAEKIVLGKGTGWKSIYKVLQEEGFEDKMVLIEEERTTETARKRYFQEVHGRGILWFIRRLLNLPGQPIDDISAQIIGEKFFEKR